jgi:hypothetical protein
MKKSINWEIKRILIHWMNCFKRNRQSAYKQKVNYLAYKNRKIHVKSYIPEHWDNSTQESRFRIMGEQFLKNKMILK